MNKLMSWCLVAASLLLVACASQPLKPAYLFWREGNPSEFTSKIVVNQRLGYYLRQPIGVELDGIEVTAFSYGQTTEVPILPGKHTIRMRGPTWSVERTVHLFKGAILYLDLASIELGNNDVFRFGDTPAPPESTPVNPDGVSP